MFIPKFVADKIAAFSEKALDRILSAKDAELKTVLAAKDGQISFLEDHIKALGAQVAHERARAEAAIDALLNKEAQVAGIRNADLAQEEALSQE